MTESIHLALAVDSFYGSPSNGWYAPITEAVFGLTAEQAARVPAPGFNSVWGIVSHVAICTESILCRFEGTVQDRSAPGADQDWPAVPDHPTEAAWQAAKDHACEINHRFAEFVARLNDDELDTPVIPGKAERWKQITGVIAHNGYHACEIISVRHMLGLWLEDA